MKLVTIDKYTFNTAHIVLVTRKSSRLVIVLLVTGEQIQVAFNHAGALTTFLAEISDCFITDEPKTPELYGWQKD